ncbi:MAG: Fic family protein [Alphaproteobacteria bacterium]|nr:Fic family protein [Alphaproteobacteria bacterium]
MDTSEVNNPKSTRAGVYVRQPTGYRAYIPKPLPPHPALSIPPSSELQKLLSESDRALGRLDGSIQTLPNPDLFMSMYVRKEALLSSQIEGTQASLSDVIRVEANLSDAGYRGDADEVINYVTAMNYGLERLKTIPLSLRLIREIHEKLMKGVRGGKMQPGEFRRSQNWIGPQGCTLADAFFVPPPQEEAVKALGDLEIFLHENDSVPPLIKIGLAHAQFETIHPFLDGNGRMGRLLITFFLCNKDILQKPVLYLSYYFRKRQDEYYNRLQRVRDFGEWEEWLRFFLTGVTSVAKQATETAKRIVSLREDHRRLIIERFGNSSGNAMRVLEHMYERPYLTVNTVKEMLGISFPNASKLIDKFVNAALLVEITGRSRNRIFRYSSYMDLFSNLTDDEG